MFHSKQGKRVELLSVHIPKTAGTSFRNTLIEVYGSEAVTRVDYPPEDQRDQEDPFAPPPEELSRKVKVLHGHFNPVDLGEFYAGIPKDVKVITWVRNPVERVISNYFYLRQRIRDEIRDNTPLNVGVTNRMVKTLMEYAIQDIARNRMASFLRGMPLDQFTFVGIQEHYTEDLSHLAKILGWINYVEHFHNVTEDKYSDVSEETWEEIKALNSLDWELYQEALAIRAARR
jgi:hypothetical protein